jgi:uncharacterized protein YutE (UPF0331/DUF86 family)
VTALFLQEHALAVRASERLAHKEAGHLRYSLTTLFALPIDLPWVRNLAQQPELAEKVEAFASRFAQLQDHLGDKLLHRCGHLLGESPKSLIDALAFAERAGLLRDADEFIAARRLRNALVHEYMQDAEVFLGSLMQARQACALFFDVIDRVGAALERRGVPVAD